MQAELSAAAQELQDSRTQAQVAATELLQGQQDLSDAVLEKREAEKASQLLRAEVQALQVGTIMPSHEAFTDQGSGDRAACSAS